MWPYFTSRVGRVGPGKMTALGLTAAGGSPGTKPLRPRNPERFQPLRMRPHPPKFILDNSPSHTSHHRRKPLQCNTMDQFTTAFNVNAKNCHLTFVSNCAPTIYIHGANWHASRQPSCPILAASGQTVSFAPFANIFSSPPFLPFRCPCPLASIRVH